MQSEKLHTNWTAVGIGAASNSVSLRGARGNVVMGEVDQNIGDVKRLKIGGKVGITFARAFFAPRQEDRC
ncbi:hypothetical protein OI25_7155 [Paraburkholderia fungorum]|jgi:hypothetical protein|uniref:Uncharacterized protein n=1 Tax=Paraburkholderia fungorum TaxID=134537 RepID=A0AAU8TAA2_9BURK|nr:hypothetical protein OI25_7155 [Paraburkholderia fungorum]